jgi:protein SCO1/2
MGRWLWLAPVAAVLIVGRAWLWPHEFHGILLQGQEPVADFSLTASTGETLRLSHFRGEYVLLFFGYTACPDVCPMTLVELAKARSHLAARQAGAQVIFVSVDPVRDTPPRLAGYLAAFDPTFLGMTGTREEISAITTRFGVFFDAASGQENVVEHTAATILLDPGGRVRLLFSPGTAGEDIASDLIYLMNY